MIKNILKNIVLVLLASGLIAAVLLNLFDLDLKTRELIFKYPQLKPFEHVVVRHNHRYYADLLLFGMPGDTVLVYKGLPMKNGQFFYKDFVRLFMVDLSSVKEHYTPDEFPVNFEYFTIAQYLRLKDKVLITPVALPRNFADSSIFPYSQALSWNKDNLGRIILPFKGMVLQLTKSSYYVYKPLIEQYEHRKLSMKHGKIYVNGKPARFYKFRHNYYYVLNKNLDANFDSRFWGPIPRRQIVGKRIFKFGENFGGSIAQWYFSNSK